MKLSTFIGWRLLFSIGVLIGLSILIFLIVRVVPGDPVRLALGSRAPDEVVQEVRKNMHLDEPIYVQYYIWLRNMLHGDFGRSLYTRRNVFHDVVEFLPATMELALLSGLIMVVGAIALGSISAQYSNTIIDNISRLISYTGVVTPAFIFAILFILIFSYALGIFPTAGRLSPGIEPPPTITGMITIDGLISGNFNAVSNALWHLFLPALALAMAGLGQESRITRSSMTDNLQKDYISAHRSYGIPERIVIFKYLLKPSLIPTVSVMALDFAALLSNAFLVELVFNWPGISRYGINAILRKDLNAITAVVMILGVTFVTVNILVDIIVAYLDPRIRLGRERG